MEKYSTGASAMSTEALWMLPTRGNIVNTSPQRFVMGAMDLHMGRHFAPMVENVRNTIQIPPQSIVVAYVQTDGRGSIAKL